jgi:hypothetical protein
VAGTDTARVTASNRRPTQKLVTLRDRHDQAEVGVDHQVLHAFVAALDPLRERDLLVGGQ